MSILNVNKINPVGGGSTITIAGIASVTNNISVGNSVTAGSFVGPIEGAVTGNVSSVISDRSEWRRPSLTAPADLLFRLKPNNEHLGTSSSDNHAQICPR